MIDNSKEYIICAAIHYDNGKEYSHQYIYGIKTGFVLGGYRHPNIVACLPTNIYFEKLEDYSNSFAVKWSRGKRDSEGNILPDAEENGKTYQGFITSLGKFVNRKEAAIIALNCGQIDKLKFSDQVLYSEDLY